MWIDSDRAFTAFCDEAAESPQIGIDLEFQGEGRYVPQLCLVQIATPHKIVAVDPFRVNITPLGPILAAPEVQKIFHAGTQDIAILQRETGITPVSVFDTQIAAAFLGFGESVGYVALVSRCLKVFLSKRQQFTDWTRRPLNREQVDYALNDVRYLLALSQLLAEQLEQRQRWNWVAEACAEMVTQALQTRTPEQAYLRFGKLAGLTRRELGVLRELATWREYTARAESRPATTILGEDVMRQLCYVLPKTDSELRQIRGFKPNLPASLREEILLAIRRGLALPESELPEPFQPRENDADADTMASLLGAVVRAQATSLELAPALITTRDELIRLANWAAQDGQTVPPDLNLLQGWRASVVGNLLVDILRGKVGIRVDRRSPGSLAMVELPEA